MKMMKVMKIMIIMKVNGKKINLYKKNKRQKTENKYYIFVYAC